MQTRLRDATTSADLPQDVAEEVAANSLANAQDSGENALLTGWATPQATNNGGNRQSQGHGRSMANLAAWTGADVEFIPCADGKARPTQPGLHPLADGLPGRVGQLRAYGNSIVPQAAAAFIKAYMDVRP